MGNRISLDVVYRPKKKARSSKAEQAAHNGQVVGSSPTAPTNSPVAKPKRAKKAKAAPIAKAKKVGRPATGFDKKQYQRDYMRDRTQALKAGLSVKEWRKRNAKS